MKAMPPHQQDPFPASSRTTVIAQRETHMVRVLDVGQAHAGVSGIVHQLIGLDCLTPVRGGCLPRGGGRAGDPAAAYQHVYSAESLDRGGHQGGDRCFLPHVAGDARRGVPGRVKAAGRVGGLARVTGAGDQSRAGARSAIEI
jgi:hypothetical protein